MGKLDSKGDLAAVELAIYCPALVIGAFVVFRHGISRQLGWFYVCTLSILRIVGASVLLYIETQNNYSIGLVTTAAITSAVGTAPLLLALQGFLERLHNGMTNRRDGYAGGGINKAAWLPLHLVVLAALGLAIAGGVQESSNSPGTSAFKTGHDLFETASVLFLVIFLAMAGITILTVHRRSHVVPSERKLMWASLAALPFLLVRVIFSVLVSFSNVGSSFYFEDVNVWAEAFMLFLMEAIVTVFFIAAGLLTAKQPVYGDDAPVRAREGDKEMGRY